jgi:hypothetical protein
MNFLKDNSLSRIKSVLDDINSLEVNTGPLNIEKIKSVYSDASKIHEISSYSENKIVENFLKNPLFKKIFNPYVDVLFSSLEHNNHYNRCISSNSSIGVCVATTTLGIIADIGLSTIGASMIATSMVLPVPTNIIAFGCGIQILEKKDVVVEQIHSLKGVKLNCPQIFEKDETLFNASFNGTKIIKSNGTILNLPHINSIYIKEILELFNKKIFDISISLDGMVFDDIKWKYNFDVVFSHEILYNTHIGRAMLETDKILKELGSTESFNYELFGEMSMFDIDYMLSERLPNFLELICTWCCFFNLSPSKYQIIRNELIFDTYRAITVKTHSTKKIDRSKLQSDLDPMVIDLLDARDEYCNKFETNITNDFDKYVEKYPILYQLYELVNALTIARMIYSNSITVNISEFELCSNPKNIEIPCKVAKAFSNHESIFVFYGGVYLSDKSIEIILSKFSDIIPNYITAMRSIIIDYHDTKTFQEIYDELKKDYTKIIIHPDNLECEPNSPLFNHDDPISQFNEVLDSSIYLHQYFFECAMNYMWYSKISNFVDSNSIKIEPETCIIIKNIIDDLKIILDNESYEKEFFDEQLDLILERELYENNDFIKIWIDNRNSLFFESLSEKIYGICVM